MSDGSFTLGKYTVRLGLRPDNPAFPVYLIFKGETLIGRQFSRPVETDCQWLERERGVYATESKWPERSIGRRGRQRRLDTETEAEVVGT